MSVSRKREYHFKGPEALEIDQKSIRKRYRKQHRLLDGCLMVVVSMLDGCGIVLLQFLYGYEMVCFGFAMLLIWF